MAKKHLKYSIDDVGVPGVTTILQIIAKPELDAWINYVGLKKSQEIKQEAANRGTLIHEAVEPILAGKKAKSVDPDTDKIVKNFAKWSKDNVEKWLCFEQAVYNKKELYAGTLDAIAKLKDGRIMLVDLKTSKKIREEYYLQLAAYYNCDSIENDCFDLSTLEGALILHLNNDLIWESHEINLDGQYEIFLAAVKLWYWKNGKKKKETKTNA
jgi:hypothetical protein